MKLDTSPIAAIATAPGRGGIGVVRASGKSLAPLIDALFPGQKLAPRHATYIPFKDATAPSSTKAWPCTSRGRIPTPAKTCWNCRATAARWCCACCWRACWKRARIGLRLAEPGEFTRRAFLNDKLDLAQAEAVADLIDASTEAAAKSASQSLSGAFSKVVHELVDKTINLRMLVEATLDFPEEEIDFLEKSNARGQLAGIVEALEPCSARRRKARCCAKA
jgi:tRNA modification GTPase